MDENELNNIEKLNRKLYERTDGIKKAARSKLSSYRQTIKRDWDNANFEPVVKKADAWLDNSIIIKVLIVAILFFTATLAVGGFILFNKGNIISNDNVKLMAKVPSLIRAGEATT